MRPETASSVERVGQSAAGTEAAGVGAPYQPPSYQVICLACEISAYAPDGDLPLF